MREEMVCPVCLNECGQVSTDGGETWNCDVCAASHDGEERVRRAA